MKIRQQTVDQLPSVARNNERVREPGKAKRVLVTPLAAQCFQRPCDGRPDGDNSTSSLTAGCDRLRGLNGYFAPLSMNGMVQDTRLGDRSKRIESHVEGDLSPLEAL